MADIFISYAREDREWVSRLAEALQAEGFTLWWDWDLLVGKRYRETIESELQTCKATVVVWSQHSIRSDFVRDEAEEGQQRNILVPILKESVRPPAGFRQLQTADFSTWTGGNTHAEYQRMLKGLSHLVGQPAASAAAHVDAAPAPVVPPTAVEPAPAPVAEPAPAPVVEAKAPDPVPPAPVAPPAPIPAAKPPEAPHASVLGTSPPPAGAPHKTNPIWIIIAVGAVALLAVAYLIAQLFPNKPDVIKPLNGSGTPPAVHGTAPTGGTAPAGGTHPSGTTTPPPPNTGDAGSGSDEAGNTHGSGSSTGGGHGGGDTAPPTPPKPPPSNSGDTGSDTGQDVGQSH